MATDYFLKIDGIAGESLDKDHVAEIEVDGFEFGMSSGGGIGGQGGAALATFSDIVVRKRFDASSTELLKVAAAGTKSIEKALLSCRKAGGGNSGHMQYLLITLTEVLVSGWKVATMAQSGIPHEELTLNFARIEMTYWPQGEGGQSRGQKKMGWDRKQNRLT